ncbi:glycosyltransferase, partial [Escherichia coli]|uniref:glycosyltransferase n=1 Tax=Escherichia coli TaxID=562 RepID=UPI000A77E861
MCKAKVLAIIVTYNPEIIRLTECINSLAPQVERIILVDNGSNNSDLIKNISINNLEIILLSENKGIAFAQNVLRRAWKQKSLTIYFSQIRILAFLAMLLKNLRVHLRKIIKKVKMLLVLLLFLKTIVQIIC